MPNVDRERLKEKLEQLKDKIDPQIFNNPVFEQQAYHACQWILQNSQESYRGYNFIVSEDGKKVTLSEEYPSKIGNDATHNNRELNITEFSLSDVSEVGTCLVVDKSVGTAYNVSDYARVYSDSNERDKFLQRCGQSKVLLNTHYEQEHYDGNGIQLSRSTYSDSCPLGDTDVRYTDLRAQTLGWHKPEMSYDRFLKHPRVVSNASSYQAVRSYDNLGVCTVSRQEGISGYPSPVAKQLSTSLFSIHTEWPERLSYLGYNPIADVQHGELIGNDLAGTTGKSRGDILKEAALSFEAGLETSRTHEHNPPLYEVMKSIVSTANAKYRETTVGGDPSGYTGGKK